MPSELSAAERARRQETIRQTRASNAMEGITTDPQFREWEEAWARGELSDAQFDRLTHDHVRQFLHPPATQGRS